MNFKRFLLGASAFAALSLPCYPAAIFDNADAPLYTTSRLSSIEGAAAYLQIGAANVTINQIAINAQPLDAGQLKFVIFSDTAPPGSASGNLLYSDAVNVGKSSSLSYVLSDPFSFTLLANHYYDVGAVFSGNAVNYTYDFTSDTESGITSILSAQNISDFANPVQLGHGGVSDISIRLYAATSNVPEPGSGLLELLGFGSVGLGCWRRRRR